MLLSVVSALARLNIDPWQEAAELAGLPLGTATQRLTALLETLPEATRPQWDDPGTIANRLIRLLPHAAASQGPSSKAALDTGAAGRPHVLVYVIFMIIALSVQSIASSHQPPAQVGDGNPPASKILSLNTQTPAPHR